MKTADVQKAVLGKVIGKVTQATGILTSDSRMNRAFGIGSIIRHRHASEGAEISQGGVLASLYLDEIGAEVQQARSGYGLSPQ